jgi:hypothetical protein
MAGFSGGTLGAAIALAKAYTDGVALNGVPVMYPQISAVTGNWMFFNPVTNQFVDSGNPSQGETPELRVQDGMLQYRVPSMPAGAWTDLFRLPETYVHTQSTPAEVWNIQHNLGTIGVSSVFIDNHGNEFLTFIDRPASTANLLVARHGTPVAGEAHIKP